MDRLSFICYLPILLEQNGINIPGGLLYLKYLYVCIPAIATMFLLICERNVKIYLLLVSVVLGITYYQCRNVLLIAILHATFNTCYFEISDWESY